MGAYAMGIYSFLNRWRKRKKTKPIRDGIRRSDKRYWVTDGPGYVNNQTKPDPYYSLSRWVLIQGSYFEPHVAGAFYLDMSTLGDWADNHCAKAWVSFPSVRSAMVHLMLQCRDPEIRSENYITLPKGPLFHVLHPYLLDFIRMGIVRVWCAHCGEENIGANYVSTSHPSGEKTIEGERAYKCKSCDGIIDQGSTSIILF